MDDRSFTRFPAVLLPQKKLYAAPLVLSCGASLEPVLDNILTMKEAGIHLEITNLLVTGLNDSPEYVEKLCSWMADNGMRDVPLHFSRYFPHYRMKEGGPTPKATLAAARQTALSMGIKTVFLGNI